MAIRQIGNILQSRDQSLSGDNILAVVEEGEHPYDYLFGDRKPSAVAMKMRNVLREWYLNFLIAVNQSLLFKSFSLGEVYIMIIGLLHDGVQKLAETKGSVSQLPKLAKKLFNIHADEFWIGNYF